MVAQTPSGMLIEKYTVATNIMRRLRVHQWAGHLARMKPEQIAAQAMRCRGMQWWRWRQGQHHCKWTGVHPQRFRAWRWQSQIANVYGDGYAENHLDNTGWLAQAQQRNDWKSMELDFAHT